MVYIQLEALINASVWQDGPEEKCETPSPHSSLQEELELRVSFQQQRPDPQLDHPDKYRLLEPQKTMRQFRPALAAVTLDLPARLWTPALGDLYQSSILCC